MRIPLPLFTAHRRAGIRFRVQILLSHLGQEIVQRQP